MASSSNNFADTLNANFKEVYADKIENLIPEGVKLLNRIPFSGRDRQLGNQYHQPVILGHEHGVTFAGPTDDAFNLEGPVSGKIQDATVRGSQMVLRSVLGYAAASRAAGGTQKAFEDSTKFLVANMLRSLAKKLEITLMYGQEGYGTVASTSGNTVTITTSEWAPGIWAGATDMPIEFRDSSGTLRGSANVTSVDMDARTVTVDTLPSGVVANDVIWHKGMYQNDFAGVHKILTNTGTLFGVDAGTFDLFKGNTYSISPSGALSFAALQDAIARGVEKGLDSDVIVLVNPKAWSDLLTEQAALRQYDSSYSTAVTENGSQEITFYAQNGKVEIIPSIYVKEGYAYVLCLEEWLRIGSTDITFRRPGQGEEFFRELENSAGYELRAYTDQALFCYAPGKNTLIDSIEN